MNCLLTIEIERFSQSRLQAGKQRIVSVFLAIDAGNLLNPSNPPVTVLFRYCRIRIHNSPISHRFLFVYSHRTIGITRVGEARLRALSTSPWMPLLGCLRSAFSDRGQKVRRSGLRLHAGHVEGRTFPGFGHYGERIAPAAADENFFILRLVEYVRQILSCLRIGVYFHVYSTRVISSSFATRFIPPSSVRSGALLSSEHCRKYASYA